MHFRELHRASVAILHSRPSMPEAISRGAGMVALALSLHG
jgi:hypothetical protein